MVAAEQTDARKPLAVEGVAGQRVALEACALLATGPHALRPSKHAAARGSSSLRLAPVVETGVVGGVEEEGGKGVGFGERGQPAREAKSGDKAASRPASLLPNLPSRRRARPHTLTSAQQARRLTTGRAGRRREARLGRPASSTRGLRAAGELPSQ